ncbi:MAG TPA: tetratricopeptide repeat-containing diguanylate cyclase [Longimicrobium sp.]
MAPALISAADQENAATLRARALAIRHREPEAARGLAERALVAAQKLGDAEMERRAMAALGACLSAVAAEVPRAREILHDALARCERAGDDALRCEVLVELAANRASTYDFDLALRHAGDAIEAARAAGRPDEEARALRVMGTVLTAQGGFVKALPLLLQALELHESTAGGWAGDADDEGRWERAELVGRIAIVYSNMDQFERALSYYRVALESMGDRYPLNTARTLYRMGIAAEELEDLAAAEEYYRGCLELYEREGDAAGAALGRLGLTKLLLERGDVDAAEASIVRSLDALADAPLHVGYYADAVWVQGDVHLHRGRPAEALACYEQAQALFVRTERPPSHTAQLQRRFSRAYAAMGRFEEALRYFERFDELRVQHLQEQANAKMAAMMVQFDTERALQEREIHRLRTIELEREIAERKEAEAALARAQAELEERNRELHALTIRDPLTGAFNRRYLDQRLAEALPLAVRGVQPLSVMICDLDDFKRINDTCSHAVGDEVLRAVAGILRQHVRQSDVVARFGGEEFVVLFPATTLEQAAAASEKVCRLVREHAWETVHPGLAVTISAGVAEAGRHPTPETFLADADRKLYEAKRLGKDRVVA